MCNSTDDFSQDDLIWYSADYLTGVLLKFGFDRSEFEEIRRGFLDKREWYDAKELAIGEAAGWRNGE